jgi:hypothetical protein
MFTAKIVGTANAVAAGWGNMGAGLTHLIMPYILSGMEHIHPNFVAWRCAYMIPGSMQIIIGLAVLIFGQDLPDGALLVVPPAPPLLLVSCCRCSQSPLSPCRLHMLRAATCAGSLLRSAQLRPSRCPIPACCASTHCIACTPASLLLAGNYGALRKIGKKDKAKTHMELLAAVKNYRTWLMVLSYGYCFGVELTVDNNIAPYLYDQFNLDLHLAGEPPKTAKACCALQPRSQACSPAHGLDCPAACVMERAAGKQRQHSRLRSCCECFCLLGPSPVPAWFSVLNERLASSLRPQACWVPCLASPTCSPARSAASSLTLSTSGLACVDVSGASGACSHLVRHSLSPLCCALLACLASISCTAFVLIPALPAACLPGSSCLLSSFPAAACPPNFFF